MNASQSTQAHPWHALESGIAMERLSSDATTGLSSQAVARRLLEHGPNALPEPAQRAFFIVLLRQFQSPLIDILFVAAALAAAMGHWGDAAVILGVVLANALIGTYQEGRAERSMAALRKLSTLQVRVLRDGGEQAVAARDLVPGDILLLAAGDAVGADARLIDAAALAVAEATLTGESVPVSKNAAALPEATGLADRRNMVFSGTYISAGRARALVTATGIHTEVGAIARLTEGAEEPKTPLEVRITQFGRYLVIAAIGLFVAVMVLGLARGLPFSEVLMVAISQMVSVIPEGLPVAMTIALAVGMRRMAARGAIIRRLSAVETLGAITVICSDKTGTLTRNEMTVSALWLLGGRVIDIAGVGYAPQGDLTESGAALAGADPQLMALLEAVVLCNDAELLPPGGETTQWTVLGDPTEAALLVAANKAGVEIGDVRRNCPRVAEVPFDSDTKMMATSHRSVAGPCTVYIKGAPEAVLRLCGGDGQAALHAAHAAADEMAGRALRVLAVASIDNYRLESAAGFDQLAGRATLLGMLGQIDPPREEVKVAVSACRAAGIRPIMVTGDHKLTGMAIARALGIVQDGDRGVDGAELERMNDAELLEGLDNIAVFARVHPAQKLRIVEALQARGDVVAMTGDGVNDAPALARADVGVAMGITGTEVAKSAAKIVITDDNFATIVGAVEQGRVVYRNLKKVILFLFVTSIDEVLVLLLALLAGFPLPLAAVQILWINIVTESTLTVNLVMDPPDGDEMRRAPIPRNDRLLDNAMLWRIAMLTPMAVAATFGWFVWRQSNGVPYDLVRTETFTILALCQWFNALNCQSASRSVLQFGILRNRWLIGGLALSIVLHAGVLYWPPLNALFHTLPIPPANLLPLVALASSVLWVEELRKWGVRLRRNGSALRKILPAAS
ncbi:cation-translocating P-type ATPase [Massilia antarctica]|uniref:cation-translocating P-type ATPase n=1 Tax=Massilia antarctica TaxID=2765360 RepID=UPI0027D959DF|nr:HAD-IC family P-type ATPase [Massilia antarctica]